MSLYSSGLRSTDILPQKHGSTENYKRYSLLENTYSKVAPHPERSRRAEGGGGLGLPFILNINLQIRMQTFCYRAVISNSF